MRGMTETLSIGERVAWYRRRRGMSQEVLAGLVGRTADWLGKVENNRADLDRLSVIKSLADALDVQLGDLLAEPSLLDWTQDVKGRTVSALREALMDYRQLSPLLSGDTNGFRPDLEVLKQEVGDAWTAFQEGRFARAARMVPSVLSLAQAATRSHSGDQQLEASKLLAMAYQSAAQVLTKIGETELAWIAADRGLTAAQESGDPIIIGSLFRSVTHCLLSNGRFDSAKQLTADAAGFLQPHVATASPEFLSIYGTLFLAGSVAAARSEDRATTRTFLAEAEESARRLGEDANHMWTAFGPTNVAIHRVGAAMELGDVQLALDQGPQLDTSQMPTERRVRHALEVARAYAARNQTDEALSLILDAEKLAPEQVRYHFIPRQLVTSWIRRQHGKPSLALADLAQRIHVIESR
jgi:transcriptional regulator with XRE-family HTH domain